MKRSDANMKWAHVFYEYNLFFLSPKYLVFLSYKRKNERKIFRASNEDVSS